MWKAKIFQFLPNQLTNLGGQYRDRNMIEFSDLLSQYLGDVFPKPKIIYKNNEMYEIHFNLLGTISLESILSLNRESNELKSKLKSSIADLKEGPKNADVDQALIILNAFEVRWLDEDNIYTAYDGVKLKCWGIQSRYMDMPEPIVNKGKEGLQILAFFVVIGIFSVAGFLLKNRPGDNSELINYIQHRGRFHSTQAAAKDLRISIEKYRRNFRNQAKGGDSNNGEAKTTLSESREENKRILTGQIPDVTRSPFLVIKNVVQLEVVDEKGLSIENCEVRSGNDIAYTGSKGYIQFEFDRKGIETFRFEHKKYHKQEVRVHFNHNKEVKNQRITLQKKSIFTRIKEIIFGES